MELAIASFIEESTVAPTTRNAEVLAKRILPEHRHLGVYVTKDYKLAHVCSHGEFVVATGVIALLVLAQMRKHFIAEDTPPNMTGGRWAVQTAFDHDIDARTLIKFASDGVGHEIVDAALLSYEHGFPSTYSVTGMREAARALNAMAEFAIDIAVTNVKLLEDGKMMQLRRRVIDGLKLAQSYGLEIPAEPLLMRILDALTTSGQILAFDM